MIAQVSKRWMFPTLPEPSLFINEGCLPEVQEEDHSDYADISSPLWMATREPQLNQLVMQLQKLRDELMETPTASCEITFSRSHLEQVRVAFANMIRQGERMLHRLSQLLCGSFISSYMLRSVVIGEVDTTKERFTISQDLFEEDLYTTTDIDLGTRQLSKLQFFDGEDWSKASLIANVVDYQPTEPNEYNIHRLITRIKAEEEIWNKVVDEIFDLDSLVVRDKKLRHLSRYVKDIFGIKLIVGHGVNVSRLQRGLQRLVWSDEALMQVNLAPDICNQRLDFIEVKDYMTGNNAKNSGWEAIKSVVRWSGKMFEIQIQPLRNFLREREYLTKESHTSFKSNREQVRTQVAEQIPLFAFYQQLLRWLFLNPQAPPPTYNAVTVALIA
ncbi:hypothetical protein QUF64_00265 [Anaerolineales bacterium HSG6]|nr:hypothetical protein [Anaerolineales bacterium HSG6]MDM8532917.1 hypothetical protein [Anaerolineales bacterium HSG25]